MKPSHASSRLNALASGKTSSFTADLLARVVETEAEICEYEELLAFSWSFPLPVGLNTADDDIDMAVVFDFLQD